MTRIIFETKSEVEYEIEMDWPMRRKEKAMSLKDAEELLEKAPVGRLGVSWKGESYVVPLNFLYCGGKIYFHCAKEGKKLEYIARNQRVCFEVDDFTGVKEGEKPRSPLRRLLQERNRLRKTPDSSRRLKRK